MQLTSPDFENFGQIPEELTCEGEGMSPELLIADIPSEAKYLAIIVDDPDAPVGLFTHWLLWNIPCDVESINSEDIPEGAVQGKNSTGTIGYTPPCPPSDTGIHHYCFMLFALSDKLDLAEGATRDEVESAIAPLDVGRAELVGQYGMDFNA